MRWPGSIAPAARGTVLTLFFSALLIVNVPSSAWADPITWRYSGEVVSTTNATAFPAGTQVDVVLVINPDAQDTADWAKVSLGPYAAFYAGLSATVSIGDLRFSEGGFPIEVNADFLGMIYDPGTDYYKVVPLSVPPYGGSTLSQTWFTVSNPAGANSSAQPLLPPDPAGAELFSLFYVGSGLTRVDARFSAVDVVPEPSSVILLMTGLAGIIATRRRRK